MNNTPSAVLTSEIPGGFWRRVLAKLVDRLVTLLPVLVVMDVLLLLNIRRLPGLWMMALMILFELAIENIYSGYFCTSGRQSPGYKYAGIKVVDIDGAILSARESTTRTLYALVMDLFLLGVIFDSVAMFNRKKRALHDFCARTKVVQVSGCRPVLPILLYCFVTLFVTVRWARLSMQAFWLPSTSMSNTLLVNDRVLVNRITYKFRDPRFGDIAVFVATPEAIKVSEQTEDGEVDYIKRCIGVPGDAVYVVHGVVYRKAVGEKTFKKLQEPYAKHIVDGPILSYDMKIVRGHVVSREYHSADITDGWCRDGSLIREREQNKVSAAAPGVVPAGQYVVFGDNRYNSNDSHSFGFVPRANFIGPAVALFLPISRARNLG